MYSVVNVGKGYGESVSREGVREYNCLCVAGVGEGNFKSVSGKVTVPKNIWKTYKSEEMSAWEEKAVSVQGMVNVKILKTKEKEMRSELYERARKHIAL